MSNLIDFISDFLSNVDFTSGTDLDNIVDSLQESGVDLTQYTPSEIREALEEALSSGDFIEDSSTEIGNEHNSQNGYEPSFEGASYSQDQAYTEFKNYLYYHCHINGYEIPYKNSLITSTGDYSLSAIDDLRTWVRELYANNKITSYDKDVLMGYLSRM